MNNKQGTLETKKNQISINMAEAADSNLCKGGCGFFGTAANNGYCSVCFKKHAPKASAGNTDAAPAPAAASEPPKAPSPAPVATPAAAASTDAPAKEPTPPPAKEDSPMKEVEVPAKEPTPSPKVRSIHIIHSYNLKIEA